MNSKDAAGAGGMPSGSGHQPEPQVRALVPRRMTSTRELLGGGNEVQIEHNGEIYTLRQTSKGKLILTK
jgi:hemin uptake protein HemP